MLYSYNCIILRTGRWAVWAVLAQEAEAVLEDDLIDFQAAPAPREEVVEVAAERAVAPPEPPGQGVGPEEVETMSLERFREAARELMRVMENGRGGH